MCVVCNLTKVGTRDSAALSVTEFCFYLSTVEFSGDETLFISSDADYSEQMV